MRFGGASAENNKAFCDEYSRCQKPAFEFVDNRSGAVERESSPSEVLSHEGDNEDIDFSYEEYTLKHDSGIYY